MMFVHSMKMVGLSFVLIVFRWIAIVVVSVRKTSTQRGRRPSNKVTFITRLMIHDNKHHLFPTKEVSYSSGHQH